MKGSGGGPGNIFLVREHPLCITQPHITIRTMHDAPTEYAFDSILIQLDSGTDNAQFISESEVNLLYTFQGSVPVSCQHFDLLYVVCDKESSGHF